MELLREKAQNNLEVEGMYNCEVSHQRLIKSNTWYQMLRKMVNMERRKSYNSECIVKLDKNSDMLCENK